MPLDAIHEVVDELDYPMFIVTVAAGDQRAGCLVGFTTQCSIDPLRFLVCLSDKNMTFRIARRAEVVVVHLLGEQASGLAELFGGQTGDRIDKFARCRWHPGPHGVPVLADCEDWFARRVLERIPAGDHWAFVLDPFDGHHRASAEIPFTFQRARRIAPGHEA